MAKTKQSPTTSAGPREYDAQPGQLVVFVGPEPRGHRVTFLHDEGLSRFLDQRAHVLEPGVAYLLPARLFAKPNSDANRMVQSGQLTVVDEPGARGAIPDVVNMSDSYHVATLRDGHPPVPTKQQRAEGWRGTVIDGSLADAIVTVLMELGLPDDLRDPRTEEIVRDLVATYDRSFIEHRAFHQPWAARSQELIAIHRAREAGLVETEGR